MKPKLKIKRKTYSFRIEPGLIERAQKKGYDIPAFIEGALKELLGIAPD